MLRPCFEPPVVALEAGRAVGEDLGCLQHDAAASAAGIDQDGEDGGGAVVRGGGRRVARACHGVRAGLLPAKLSQGQRGVVGPQHVGGAGADRLAREALEQRVAGKVEVQAGAVAAQREEDVRVGVIHVHVGATAGDLDEAVAQGILHAQGGIMGVAQLIARAARRDGDGCARREDVLPSDGARALVQVVRGDAIEAGEGNKDAARQARPQAGAVGIEGRARERDAALEAPNLTQAERAQFVGKGGFKALGAARVKLVRGSVGRREGRLRHGHS